MKRLLVSAMVLAASVVATQSVYAAPGHVSTPVRAAVVVNGKLIKFSVRNDSGSPMRLKAGDNEVSIAPGKTADMKLPAGTQITALECANREAGALVATVSDSLAGATLALR